MIYDLHTDNWIAMCSFVCLFVLFCSLSVIPLILIGNVEVNEASLDILEGLFANKRGNKHCCNHQQVTIIKLYRARERK